MDSLMVHSRKHKKPLKNGSMPIQEPVFDNGMNQSSENVRYFQKSKEMTIRLSSIVSRVKKQKNADLSM